MVPSFWQSAELWDIGRHATAAESYKRLSNSRESATMTKLQELGETESAELFEEIGR
jgi:hypothetical protein